MEQTKEIKLKIVTYDNMYYTLKTIKMDDILKMKKEMEKESTENVCIDDIINRWITDTICEIFGINMLDRKYMADDKLIFLYEEQKMINTKEIKKTMIQLL